MTALHFRSAALSPQKRADRVFSGDLIIFKNVGAMVELCSHADAMARTAFAPYQPDTAHEHYSPEDYLAILDPLQRRFTNDPEAKRLFHAALEACGVDRADTYCDWFPMRILPGRNDVDSMSTSGLHAHRDTWFGNLYAQQNWWAPLYPLEPGRSIVFYPKYFDRPIVNNSSGWDLMDFREARKQVRLRNGSAQEVRDAYPAIEAQEPIDEADGVIVVIEPGDILCFSPAHLHGTVPNSTRHARFSTELRTVSLEDLRAQRMAPNVDAKSTSNSVVDFFSMQDDEPLSDAMARNEIKLTIPKPQDAEKLH